ncbi:MAG: hypothetical protein KAJ17_00375, partial [Candidatus Krumholzibacteria bacterium]|nr:hypothetical protein [Candidatus Krumholzibacteria bacterium]
MQRTILFVILLLVAGFGIYSCLESDIFAPGAVSAYLLLMLLPGAGFYLLLEKDPQLLELAMAGTVLSPVLVSIVAVLAMLSGLPPKAAAVGITLLAAVFGIAVILTRAPLAGRWEVSFRQALVLFGIIVAFCA